MPILSESDEQLIRDRCRVMQIVVIALIMGVIGGGGIFYVIKSGDGAIGIFTFSSLGISIMAVIMSRIVPAMMASSSTRTMPSVSGSDSPKIENILADIQKQKIVSCGLLEGAAFISLFSVFIEGSVYPYIWIAALILAMISCIPIPDRMVERVKEELR